MGSKKTKNGIERWVKITKTKNSSNKTEKKTPKTSQKQTRGKKLKTNDIVVYKNRKVLKMVIIYHYLMTKIIIT